MFLPCWNRSSAKRKTQELYEKKLTTYPRTDARVLTTAVAKEIGKNLRGISTIQMYRDLLVPVLESGSWKKIGKTRYTNDKAVTDHYAIIPTGEGLKALPSLSKRSRDVYELIVRRFIAIFYPPAVYDRVSLTLRIRTEAFTASLRTCVERGYLEALEYSFFRKKDAQSGQEGQTGPEDSALQTGLSEDPSRTGERQCFTDRSVRRPLKDRRERVQKNGQPCRRNGCGCLRHAGIPQDSQKRHQAPGRAFFHQGRRNGTAQTLYLRQYDPGHGERGPADRRRGAS